MPSLVRDDEELGLGSVTVFRLGSTGAGLLSLALSKPVPPDARLSSTRSSFFLVLSKLSLTAFSKLSFIAVPLLRIHQLAGLRTVTLRLICAELLNFSQSNMYTSCHKCCSSNLLLSI